MKGLTRQIEVRKDKRYFEKGKGKGSISFPFFIYLKDFLILELELVQQ